MDGTLAVAVLFLLSTAVMIALILRKPSFSVRIATRTYRFDSYFLGALLAPVLFASFGLMDPGDVLRGLQGSGTLNPAGILILFLSMVFLSIYLDTTGFFEYCARLALRSAKSSGVRLFLAFYAVVSLLTIVTSNDIIILSFTPFIYYFTKRAEVDPTPYLVAEFFGANTWSIMLYIGNPTNIVMASAFGLDFFEYFRWMVLPTLAAGAASLALLLLIFRRRIAAPIRPQPDIDPRQAITDLPGAVFGVVMLFSCIATLAVAPVLGLPMWEVALGFAVALLVALLVRDVSAAVRRVQHLPALVPSVRRMPFEIVPFVLAMFISVEALRAYAITADFGSVLGTLAGGSESACVLLFGFASALSANLVNNIPMTVAFVPVVQTLTPALHLPAIYATVVGSNLGATITPLGALAGIMWIGLLREKQVTISFRSFIVYGLLVTPVTLIACLGVLAVEFMVL